MSSTPKPNGTMAGCRALVPPSRPDVHPLQRMLEREGAAVIVFPTLQIDEFSPADPADRARPLERWASFDWIVVSGAPSARRWLPYADARTWQQRAGARPKLAAIGAGAAGTLRKAGLPPDRVPRRHTAAEVSEELGDLAGKRILLIRVRDASRALPQRLAERRADVTEVEGYRVRLHANELTTDDLSFIAFANPTAVRFFARGVREAALPWWPDPERVGIAAAGPATAAAAQQAGIRTTIVAEGSLRSLVECLRRRYRGR